MGDALKKWARDALERAGRTFLQVLIGFLSVDGTRVGFEDINWMRALSVSTVAALASVLTSVFAVLRGDPTDASLLK